jgi:hypothetical protein
MRRNPKNQRLTLFREIIGIFLEQRMKNVNKLRGGKEERGMLPQVVRIVGTVLYRVKPYIQLSIYFLQSQGIGLF